MSRATLINDTWILPLASAALLALLLACGSEVSVPAGSDSGGGGTINPTTSTSAGCGAAGSGAGGSGGGSFCVYDCGSDALVSPECQSGQWQCPAGATWVHECPPSTCWGAPLACELCGSGWECHPEPSCIGHCESLLCAVCPADDPGPTIIAGCSCACDSGGMYGCEIAPGCCMEDIDCGDEIYAPCVNNVCKQTLDDGCWTDVECAPGQSCVGADVCPCGYDCDAPDTPGSCM